MCEKMPLHSAVKKDQVEVAKLLINYGANVNVKDVRGNTPLVYAIRQNCIEMTKLLLSNGVDIKDNPNLLCTAAGKGCLTIVEDLLKYGADVNMLDSSRFRKGLTPLHSAVKINHVEVAKLLINYGVNVNVKDYQGYAPIDYAIEKKYKKMTELFLLNEADINEDPRALCRDSATIKLIMQHIAKMKAAGLHPSSAQSTQRAESGVHVECSIVPDPRFRPLRAQGGADVECAWPLSTCSVEKPHNRIPSGLH